MLRKLVLKSNGGCVGSGVGRCYRERFGGVRFWGILEEVVREGF